MLKNHRVSDQNDRVSQEVDVAVRHLDNIVMWDDGDYFREHKLDPEYTDLMDSLEVSDWSQLSDEEHYCLRYGHKLCEHPSSPDDRCVICAQLWHMAAIRTETAQKIRKRVQEEVEAEVKARTRTFRSTETLTRDDDVHGTGKDEGDSDDGRVEEHAQQGSDNSKDQVLPSVDKDGCEIETLDDDSDEATEEDVNVESESRRTPADPETD